MSLTYPYRRTRLDSKAPHHTQRNETVMARTGRLQAPATTDALDAPVRPKVVPGESIQWELAADVLTRDKAGSTATVQLADLDPIVIRLVEAAFSEGRIKVIPFANTAAGKANALRVVAHARAYATLRVVNDGADVISEPITVGVSVVSDYIVPGHTTPLKLAVTLNAIPKIRRARKPKDTETAETAETAEPAAV